MKKANRKKTEISKYLQINKLFKGKCSFGNDMIRFISRQFGSNHQQNNKFNDFLEDILR